MNDCTHSQQSKRAQRHGWCWCNAKAKMIHTSECNEKCDKFESSSRLMAQAFREGMMRHV